jgi:hypothetical protein
MKHYFLQTGDVMDRVRRRESLSGLLSGTVVALFYVT